MSQFGVLQINYITIRALALKGAVQCHIFKIQTHCFLWPYTHRLSTVPRYNFKYHLP